MELFEAINTRRSIREYTDEPISDADLETILRAAMQAPSACNEQSWRFVVVRDAGRREELAHVSPYTRMAAKAPVVIVVCGDLAAEKAPGMWVQDCSASTENLLLAARGLDIGTVWCGVHPVPEREASARRILNLPESVVPLGLICLGHPAQKFRENDRFNEKYVHYEQWGGK